MQIQFNFSLPFQKCNGIFILAYVIMHHILCVSTAHEIFVFFFLLVLLKGLNGENLVALAPVSTLALKVCAFLFGFRGLLGYLK